MMVFLINGRLFSSTDNLWSQAQAKKFLSCEWLHYLARCNRKNKSKNDNLVNTEKHTSVFW